jgi:hypothetical protein
MLHDIAVNRIRINYTQLTPQVAVTIDTVAQTTDVDDVINRIADGVDRCRQADLRVPV